MREHPVTSWLIGATVIHALDQDFYSKFLPCCTGAVVVFIGFRMLVPRLKAWCVQRWKVTSGAVTDTLLVRHAQLVGPVWSKSASFSEVETQYVTAVKYTFDDGGIGREGRSLERFRTERAAHKFLGHFHVGQTISVRHMSVWPYPSVLEFEPRFLDAARDLDHTTDRKAVSLGSRFRRALFLVGIALAVCVVIGLALILFLAVTHRS